MVSFETVVGMFKNNSSSQIGHFTVMQVSESIWWNESVLDTEDWLQNEEEMRSLITFFSIQIFSLSSVVMNSVVVNNSWCFFIIWSLFCTVETLRPWLRPCVLFNCCCWFTLLSSLGSISTISSLCNIFSRTLQRFLASGHDVVVQIQRSNNSQSIVVLFTHVHTEWR